MAGVGVGVVVGGVGVGVGVGGVVLLSEKRLTVLLRGLVMVFV